MALMQCHECGKEVSDQAEKCPHCGVKVKRKLGPIGWVWRGFVLLFLGVLAYSCTTLDQQRSSAPPKPFGSTESGALALCQKAIKEASRDPATAEVPYVASVGSAAEFYFAWNNGTKPLRLKNGFGALLAATGSCTVNSTTGQITGVTIDGRRIL